MNKKNNYIFEIILLPIIIIIFLVISITSYNLHLTKVQFEKQIENKKIEFINNQKETVYNKVNYLNSMINIEREKLKQKIKEEIAEKINIAINVAKDINLKNKNLSIKKRVELLSNRLAILKYNQNRGYYFIIGTNNIIIEHPVKELIGKDLSNMYDIYGKNIAYTQQNSLKNNEKIGFSNYHFYKPDNKKKNELKLTGITFEKSLGVYIGTGEYLEVAEEKIKDDFINKLKANKELDKYVFVLDVHNINGGEGYATLLVNNNRTDIVGIKLNDNVKDSKGNFYRKNYLKTVRENTDGYVGYWYKKPGSSSHKEKLTYFYYNKDWNWIIASGFYLEDIEPFLEKLEQDSKNQLDSIIKNSFFWGLVFSVFTILISFFIFYKIQRKINEDRQKILLSQENLKKAQHISKIGSWSYDTKSKNIVWSDEIYELLGLNKSIDKPSYDLFFDYVHKDDKKKLKSIFERMIREKKSHNFIHRLVIEGKIKWINNQSEVFSQDGSDLIVGTIQDITEKYEKDKKIEEQSQMLFHQSKMAAMGEMLENIAHQWRQPLSAISSSASGIKLENEYNYLDKEKLNKSLDDILHNTIYLSNTIDDFRTYFSKDKVLKECNVTESYLSSIKLVKSKFMDTHIEIVENYEDIVCNTLENELIQCIINILNNAYDVLVKNSIDEKLIFINIYKEYGNAVITIKDNAGGIDEKIMQKIFEPYFTTKHKSQGTGIGLYMTQEIITKHLGGFIKVTNEEFEHNNKTYKGACFKIAIPAISSKGMV